MENFEKTRLQSFSRVQLPGSDPGEPDHHWFRGTVLGIVVASCTKLRFMGRNIITSPPSPSDCSDNVITFRLLLLFLPSSYRIKSVLLIYLGLSSSARIYICWGRWIFVFCCCCCFGFFGQASCIACIWRILVSDQGWNPCLLPWKFGSLNPCPTREVPVFVL